MNELFLCRQQTSVVEAIQCKLFDADIFVSGFKHMLPLTFAAFCILGSELHRSVTQQQ